MNISKTEFVALYNKANELAWDLDRMSGGGAQAYQELMDQLDKIAVKNHLK